MRHRIAAGIVTCAVLAIPAAATAAPYPTHKQMDAVREYLKHARRRGRRRVIDSQGRVRGIHDKRRFVTASVIKAMLLVSYLRKVDHQDRGLTRYERSHLRPMIRVSSNSAATWTYYRVGDVLLRRLARRADMDQFSICCSWGYAHFSARDQAKFFWQLEQLTPPRFRDYATHLLRSIVLVAELGHPERRAAARLLGVLQGRLARDRPRPARAPGFVHPLPRRGVLARRADRRQPVDGLRDRDDRGRRAAGSCAAGRARPGISGRFQLRLAGEPSTFPAASFARTENVCEPVG